MSFVADKKVVEFYTVSSPYPPFSLPGIDIIITECSHSVLVFCLDFSLFFFFFFETKQETPPASGRVCGASFRDCRPSRLVVFWSSPVLQPPAEEIKKKNGGNSVPFDWREISTVSSFFWSV